MVIFNLARPFPCCPIIIEAEKDGVFISGVSSEVLKIEKVFLDSFFLKISFFQGSFDFTIFTRKKSEALNKLYEEIRYYLK